MQDQPHNRLLQVVRSNHDNTLRSRHERLTEVIKSVVVGIHHREMNPRQLN